VRGISPIPLASIVADDPTQARNKANYQRLNKISEDLLAEAIGIFKTMTPLQARNFRMRCLRWHGGELREDDKTIASFASERDMVMAYLETSVNPDNWELVRFGEPSFREKGEQPREFVPAIADSPNDTWPDEKRALFDYVTSAVSPENRHLVQLLNPEELNARKEKRRAKVVT
jgi:hypothetical protein